MLKCLALLSITAGCLLWGQNAAQYKQPRASTKTNQTAQTDNPIPPSKSVVNPSSTAPESQPPAPDKQNKAPADSSKWFLRPEWVTVWVTAVYTFIAGLTLWAIKRQADIMETQATRAITDAETANLTTNASLAAITRQADLMDQQVQIAVNRERARIYVKLAPSNWTFLVPGYERQLTEFQGNFVNMEQDVFEVLVINEGASKALDTRLIATISVTDVLKSDRLFEQSQLHNIEILPPGESHNRRWGIELLPGLRQELLNAIHDEKAILSFSGIVRYQDTLSNPNVFRETVFCYQWKMFSEWIEGIPDDDGYTGMYADVGSDWVAYPDSANYKT